MSTSTNHRGEGERLPRPESPSVRRLLWLAWPITGLLVALAIAYAILTSRHGVRTDRGWIDSRRATLPLPTKPVVADNGFHTYMAAVRSMWSVGNALPVPPGKEYVWPPTLDDHELSRRTWEDVLEDADLGPGDMQCIARLVRANSRALQLLHEAADKAYVSPREPDAVAYVDHCGQFRRLAQLGMAQVRVAARDGHDADALATARDVLALGANMPQYGGLMEAAFGDMAIAVIHRHAMDVIQSRRLSRAEYLEHARYVRRLRECWYPLRQSAALDFHVIKAMAEQADRSGEATLARLRGESCDAKTAAR
ncbi:MAG TPA: hypothetical protein PLQ54_15640, partial [Armatimonadota bacterium]|nr:hypothetical protein [Armatimonadota bacterium]